MTKASIKSMLDDMAYMEDDGRVEDAINKNMLFKTLTKGLYDYYIEIVEKVQENDIS